MTPGAANLGYRGVVARVRDSPGPRTLAAQALKPGFVTPVAANHGYTGVVAMVHDCAWVRSPMRPFFSRVGSSPDSMIFRKRFKNSSDSDSLTLVATQCRKRSTIAKKIFKSAHHARRRIKKQFPMIFVGSVIKLRFHKIPIIEWEA